MSTAEIKLKLFREIDLLDESKLREVYGLLFNFLNKENDTEEWNALSLMQQTGLLNAFDELNSSEGTDHKTIMDKFRKKVCLNQLNGLHKQKMISQILLTI